MSKATTRRDFLKVVSTLPAVSTESLAGDSKVNRNSESDEGRDEGLTPGTDTSNQSRPESPEILERSPFAPQNLDLVDPIFYPRGKPFGDNGPGQTESEVRTQLRETFTKRFSGDQQRVAQAMNAFDDPLLEAKCPDHELRGATVILQGTSGEGGFEAVMNDPGIGNITYANVAGALGNDRALATTRISPQGAVIIQVDERLRGEDIRALAPTIMHETLHTDFEISPKEELIANTMEATNYGEFVVEAPTLSRQDTVLVRRANTELMARINSRDERGEMRLLDSQGPILPESTRTDLQPFADLTIYSNVGDAYPNWEAVPNTPGNSQLHAILGAQTGTYVQSADFDDRTITLLDRNQVVLSAEDQLRLLEALALAPTSPET